MAEPVGAAALEREARQLVEAAARWLTAVPDSGEYAGRTVDREADAEASTGMGDAQTSGGLDDPEMSGGSDGPEMSGGSGGAHSSPGADGPADASGEHLCHGCPWCRAKAAAAGPIGAGTLESLAHLLGSAAESLALFAQSRRETAPEAPRAEADGADVDGAETDGDEAGSGEGAGR